MRSEGYCSPREGFPAQQREGHVELETWFFLNTMSFGQHRWKVHIRLSTHYFLLTFWKSNVSSNFSIPFKLKCILSQWTWEKAQEPYRTHWHDGACRGKWCSPYSALLVSAAWDGQWCLQAVKGSCRAMTALSVAWAWWHRGSGLEGTASLWVPGGGGDDRDTKKSRWKKRKRRKLHCVCLSDFWDQGDGLCACWRWGTSEGCAGTLCCYCCMPISSAPQAAGCGRKDEREPLNLLSSIMLLQALLAWLAYYKQSMEREDGVGFFYPEVLQEIPDMNKDWLLSAARLPWVLRTYL